MKSDFQIRTGTWEDAPSVGALMALATDPFVRCILPDPHDFVTGSLTHAGITTAPAFDMGTVYMISDAFGAAVWLHPAQCLNVRTKPSTVALRCRTKWRSLFKIRGLSPIRAALVSGLYLR